MCSSGVLVLFATCLHVVWDADVHGVVIRVEEDERDAHDGMLAESSGMFMWNAEAHILLPDARQFVHTVTHQQHAEGAWHKWTGDVCHQATAQKIHTVRHGQLLHERRRQNAHTELAPHTVRTYVA